MRMPSRRARVVLGVLVCIATVGGFVGWQAMALQQTAREARDHLGAAREALTDTAVSTGGDPAAASLGQTHLASACTEAAAAAAALRDVNGQLQTIMPVVGALEAVPGVGDRARAQAVTLEAGTQIANAGTALCDGLAPLVEFLSASSSDSSSQSASQVLQALAAARPELLDAEQRLAQLQQSLSALRDEDLDVQNRSAVIALRARLPGLVSKMHDADALLGLLGSDTTRRYLLLSQNPDELRATGGYIGSAGVVEARNGRVRLVEYGSSRNYDTPPDLRVVPPPAFRDYLGASFWHLAAANWWASFPDVARQAAYFYALSHPGETLDGVIALDQFGLQRLLEVLGPVDVPDFGERVGAADVEAKLDRYVHASDSSDESQRKQFTAALSSAVLQAVMSAPRGALQGLVKAGRIALDEQHLLVWVGDADATQLFASRRWNGALLPASGDALLLVDTEVGASKQSQAVTRDAQYSVSLAPGESPRASLAITYTNQSRPEHRPDVRFVSTYRTLLRVFVPPGATLTSASGFDGDITSSQECGRQVFGGQVSVAEGASSQVSLSYRLPTTAVASGYDLLVQQQPGVPPGHLSVSVAPATQPAAHAEIGNAPGRHARWQLDPTESPVLRDAPLPQSPTEGCGIPPVQAQPIAPPEWLQIPSAGIDSSVVDLGVQPSGEMEAPLAPDVVGWYRMSARPGQPGNSVMSGHVDWGRNTAVFWGLRNLVQGDRILVRGADGIVHTYAVEWNESFAWQTAPVDRIVGPSRQSLLTLITCDGVFDQQSREYSERRVVRAQLID